MEEKLKKKVSVPFIIGLIVGCIVIIGVIVIAVFFVVSGSDTKRFNKQLELGEKYIDELDYDNAILAYQKALEIDPNNIESYKGIVNACLGKGDIDEAVKWAEIAYKETQDSWFLEISEEMKKKAESTFNISENMYNLEIDNKEVIDGEEVEIYLPENYYSSDKDYKVGDTIKFGKYEQDGDTKNGLEYIEWEVMSIEDDKMLIYSRDIVDYMQFNNEWESVTWESSSLRKWMNEDFINEAFSDNEQTLIYEVENPCDDRLGEGHTNSPTLDKVFCLSEEEIIRLYGFDFDYFYTTDYPELKAESTDYALNKINNLREEDFYFTNNYWLRTCSQSSMILYSAEAISEEGRYGGGAVIGYCGVKPGVYVLR